MFALKKIAVFSIFALSLFFIGCSSANDSSLLSSNSENLMSVSQKIESKTVWTRELEAVRLIQDITKEAQVLSSIQLKPSVINISNIDFPPVFPVLDGFSSLDLSDIPEKLLLFIQGVSDSVSTFSLSKISSTKAGTESLVYFQNDLKNGYENYFSVKFPEFHEGEENKEIENREKIFSDYIIGLPSSREDIIIVPVRFYKNSRFIDVHLFIENQEELKLAQIRILGTPF